MRHDCPGRIIHDFLVLIFLLFLDFYDNMIVVCSVFPLFSLLLNLVPIVCVAVCSVNQDKLLRCRLSKLILFSLIADQAVLANHTIHFLINWGRKKLPLLG